MTATVSVFGVATANRVFHAISWALQYILHWTDVVTATAGRRYIWSSKYSSFELWRAPCSIRLSECSELQFEIWASILRMERDDDKFASVVQHTITMIMSSDDPFSVSEIWETIDPLENLCMLRLWRRVSETWNHRCLSKIQYSTIFICRLRAARWQC